MKTKRTINWPILGIMIIGVLFWSFVFLFAKQKIQSKKEVVPETQQDIYFSRVIVYYNSGDSIRIDSVSRTYVVELSKSICADSVKINL